MKSISRFCKRVLFYFVIVTLSSPLFAQSSNNNAEIRASEKKIEKKEQCISIKNQETAALVAQDWKNLERLAKRFVGDCNGVIDAQWVSGAYENIALANLASGKINAALSAADACSKAYYASAGCHVQKARAQIELGKKAEAKRSLDISEKLAKHSLEIASRALNQAYTETDKDVQRADIARNEAYLNLIASLRSDI